MTKTASRLIKVHIPAEFANILTYTNCSSTKRNHWIMRSRKFKIMVRQPWIGRFIISYTNFHIMRSNHIDILKFASWVIHRVTEKIILSSDTLNCGSITASNIMHTNIAQWTLWWKYPLLDGPCLLKATLISRFMGPTWDPPGADRTQVGQRGPREPCYLGIYRQQNTVQHENVYGISVSLFLCRLDFHETSPCRHKCGSKLLPIIIIVPNAIYSNWTFEK